MTKEEIEFLKSRIFADFEQEYWPFDNKEITSEFIKYLALIEIGEEEIYSFFEEYSQTYKFYINDMYNKFKNYPRIYFWMKCKFLSEEEKYITEIAEYIVEKEMDRLVEDIKKYFKENEQELKNGRRYEDSCDRPDYIDFCPSIWLKKECPNKLYPFELFEIIKEAIPKEYVYGFEYKPLEDPFDKHYSEFSEKNKETEKEKIIENTLPQGILSQEMSDIEIIDKMKEYEGMFLDRAMEEKNECIYKFIMRKTSIPLWTGETDEEFIDYVLKTEIKKFGKGFRSPLAGKYFYQLFGDIKDDTVIWNSIHNQKSHFYDDDFSNKVSKIFLHRDDLIERILQISLRESIFSGEKNLEDISKKVHLLTLIGTKKSFLKMWEVLGARKCDMDLYEKVINEWAEHFPIKLLRKELENENDACILGILCSKNEYAIRAIFAMLYKNYNLTIKQCTPIFINNEDLDYKEYYKLLINLSISIDDLSCDCSEHILFYNKIIRRWYSPLHKELLLDIIGIIKNDKVFGQKIKKMLEKLNIDLTYELTFEQFNEIEKLNRDKIPFALWKIYANCPDYIEAKFWLHEHKKLDLSDYAGGANYYNSFRNITLEKPFFYPEYSFENRKIMDGYFYRELPFLDFAEAERQPKKIIKDPILWKRYLQKFIEESYKKLEQKKFKKPLLPIIPEYAEYLLSRTDDMFSTAIENIPYNEYKTFLTESRKLQIKICLKNNTIQKEEFDKLMTLAENPSTNYCAWSDEEIKNCLLPGTDLEKLNAILEPEFMVRIFEKSILWVIEHKNSELWLNAPWFGMQIFNKSYIDRPAIWAKHLIKIVDEWKVSENMLIKICTALGHLREPLGSKVPIKLREMSENPQNENIKKDILIQLSLFNHENFKKMYHKGNEIKRIELCKIELIRGQNREVKEKMQKD